MRTFGCKDDLLYSKICKRLPSDFSLVVYDCVDSTNKVLKEMANEGAKDKTVVLANTQTDGRGRLGRSFFSPNGSGIYMSVLLKPNMAPDKATNITACAGVAVCTALEKIYNISPKIKWVNDVFIEGKKVCGILAESVVNPQKNLPEYCVLGIGLNLFAPNDGFPSEISQIAGSVVKCNSINIEEKAHVISQILIDFFKIFDKINGNSILNEYKKRMFLINETVTVNAAVPFEAKIIDINEDFSLKLQMSDGKIINLNTGEIGIKPC